MTFDEWCERYDQRPWRPITVDDVTMFRTHIRRLEATVTELEAELNRLAAIAPIPDPYPDDDSPTWHPPTVEEAVAAFHKHPSSHTCREIGRALRRAENSGAS